MMSKRQISFAILAVVMIASVLYLFNFQEAKKRERLQESFKKSMEGNVWRNTKIYILETSGKKKINHREACSIESIARANPGREVRLLFTNPNLDFKDPFMQHLVMRENVRLLQANLEKWFEGTPLQDWYEKKKFEKCPHKAMHLSDALRMAVIWKYGGVFMDTDSIALRSVDDLHNVIATEPALEINSAFFAMDKASPFLQTAMESFSSNYDCKDTGNMGHKQLAYLFITLCHKKMIHPVPEVNDCGLTKLSPDAVYPVAFQQRKLIFADKKVKDVDALISNNTYVVHLFDAGTNKIAANVGKSTAWEKLMKAQCPEVHSISINRFKLKRL